MNTLKKKRTIWYHFSAKWLKINRNSNASIEQEKGEQ